MILQKCKRGHYYDSDKFAECPYCALEKNVAEEKTENWFQGALEATETVIGKYPSKDHRQLDGIGGDGHGTT